MSNWFQSLGAKTTPSDPTGRKHHLTFIAFIAVMLLVIVILAFVQNGKADAQTDDADRTVFCIGPVSGISPQAAGYGDHWVRLTTNRWCYENKRFVNSSPTFTRTRGDGLVWHFNWWFPTQSQNGFGTAPNGQTNVQYRAQWVAAEFKYCVGIGPAQVCTHRTNGVRIWAWANGNYSVQSSTSVPSLPMPRP